MLPQITTLKNDFELVTFVSTLSIYGLYFLATWYLLCLYRSRDSARPYHYKLFRLYNSSVITSTLSRAEQQFYVAANKVTRVFNFLLIASAMATIVNCLTTDSMQASRRFTRADPQTGKTIFEMSFNATYEYNDDGDLPYDDMINMEYNEAPGIEW